MSPGFKTATAGFVLMLLIGCAGMKPAPFPEPSATMPPSEETIPPETGIVPPEVPLEEPGTLPAEPPEAPPEAPNPRALASLELSSQAQILIGEGRLDEAIRILERSVNLYPGSGENYYYLAEAWRLKGNAGQATEYNTLAAIRLKNDTEWMDRIDLQKRRIERIR